MLGKIQVRIPHFKYSLGIVSIHFKPILLASYHLFETTYKSLAIFFWFVVAKLELSLLNFF